MNLKILQDTPPWQWPLDVGKTFLRVLKDRRAAESDRLIAAELAGDSVAIDNDLADALLVIVENPNEPEELRAQAVISFGPALELAWTFGFVDSDMLPPITERRYGNIRNSLRQLYLDNTTPTEVRRRILEAAVRAPEAWQEDAIEAAYASGDRDWMLTAVFGMRHVRGFGREILEALKSTGPDIHFEAVAAAGNWKLDAAWPHIAKLVRDAATPKPLLLAAIEAVGDIRPHEARYILRELADSKDEEIAGAAEEAMMLAESAPDEDEEEEEEEEDGEWVN